MTVGDIKGPEVIELRVTYGATVAIGDVVHLEADDGKWDPVADNDKGKFGVARTAGADTEEGAVIIYGRAEVKASGATIAKGELVIPSSTAVVKKYAVATDASGNTVIGTAMEAFDASGNGTIFVGLVQ
jgi:hypothetical protein